jgi:hypothetical protein
MVLEIFEDAAWEVEGDYGGKSVSGTSVWRWEDGMGDGMEMEVGGMDVRWEGY